MRVGDFVALQEGVEVVVCGVKKKNKQTALSFLRFERTTMGPQNDVQEGIKKKKCLKLLSRGRVCDRSPRSHRGAHVLWAQSAIPSGFQSTPCDVAALPEVLFL